MQKRLLLYQLLCLEMLHSSRLEAQKISPKTDAPQFFVKDTEIPQIYHELITVFVI